MALYVKGSAEEQIKQDLQAVAEGVAASVLHSGTHSNPDSHDRNEFEANQDGDIQNSSVDMQHKAKAEVIYLLPYFFFFGGGGVVGWCFSDFTSGFFNFFFFLFFSLVYFRTSRTNCRIRHTLVFQCQMALAICRLKFLFCNFFHEIMCLFC